MSIASEQVFAKYLKCDQVGCGARTPRALSQDEVHRYGVEMGWQVADSRAPVVDYCPKHKEQVMSDATELKEKADRLRLAAQIADKCGAVPALGETIAVLESARDCALMVIDRAAEFNVLGRDELEMVEEAERHLEKAIEALEERRPHYKPEKFV